MATDVITIWNQALGTAGGRATVSSQAENTREANLCRLWYENVRDNVLKAASWPSASNYQSLALLAERSDVADWTATAPAPGFRYAYAVPSDMIAPRHLHSFERFKRALYGEANAIHTNAEGAILHYTKRQDDVTKWDIALETCVIHTLAARIAFTLTGKVGLVDRLQSTAYELILENRTMIANETDDQMEDLPSWISVRGYDGLPRPTKFFYPYENLNSVVA